MNDVEVAERELNIEVAVNDSPPVGSSHVSVAVSVDDFTMGQIRALANALRDPPRASDEPSAMGPQVS